MAMSSERIMPLRLVGCLDLSVMVETHGNREVAVLGKCYVGTSGAVGPIQWEWAGPGLRFRCNISTVLKVF